MPTAWPRFTNYLERFEGKALEEEEDLLSERYLMVTRLRAIENQRWFISANQIGPDEKSGLDYAGHSRIVSPLGKVLADTGYNEGLATASIQVREKIQEARIEWFDILKDRAVHTYRRVGDSGLYSPPTHLKASGEQHGEEGR
jgi:predicted amidohydrolase